MSKAASRFQMRVLQTHLSGTIGANATKLVVVESSTLHAPAWTPLIRQNVFSRVSGDGRATNSTAVRMMRTAMATFNCEFSEFNSARRTLFQQH